MSTPTLPPTPFAWLHLVREGQPAEAVSPCVRWLLCVGGGSVLVGVARLLGC
jgi:hypothetical protein